MLQGYIELEKFLKQILKAQYQIGYRYSDGTKSLSVESPMPVQDKIHELVSSLGGLFVAHQEGFKNYLEAMEENSKKDNRNSNSRSPVDRCFGHLNGGKKQLQETADTVDRAYQEDLFSQSVAKSFVAMRQQMLKAANSTRIIQAPVQEQVDVKSTDPVTADNSGQKPNSGKTMHQQPPPNAMTNPKTALLETKTVRVHQPLVPQKVHGTDVNPAGQDRKANMVDFFKELAFKHVSEKLGDTQNNPLNGFVAFYTAAKNGDRASQYRLGDMYATGNGMPKSADQAVYWFQQAAGIRISNETPPQQTVKYAPISNRPARLCSTASSA